MEAVGAGEVSATLTGPDLDGCPVTLVINGQSSSTVFVEDGEAIEVELQTEGSCSCCKTMSDCSSQSAGLWVQKSNRDKSTLTLDRKELVAKVRMATDKVRGRRRRR